MSCGSRFVVCSVENGALGWREGAGKLVQLLFRDSRCRLSCELSDEIVADAFVASYRNRCKRYFNHPVKPSVHQFDYIGCNDALNIVGEESVIRLVVSPIENGQGCHQAGVNSLCHRIEEYPGLAGSEIVCEEWNLHFGTHQCAGMADDEFREWTCDTTMSLQLWFRGMVAEYHRVRHDILETDEYASVIRLLQPSFGDCVSELLQEY